MYVEDQQGNEVGIISRQQADAIAARIEANRSSGAEFLRQMGEDDSPEAVDALIEEMKGNK